MNCLKLIQKLHQRKIFSISSVKYISNHPFKFTEAENRWKKNDEIPNEYHLVYKGPMAKVLKYTTTYLTATTAAMSVASIYYASVVLDVNQMNAPVELGDIVLANNGYEGLVYFGTFIALHLATKLVLSRYLVRLYQKEDRYIAVFNGHLHNMITKHEFSRNDVKKLKTRLVVTWPDARYALGKKHAIILDHYFKTPEHFHYLVNKKYKEDPCKD